jgi:putative component of membrane protein insertase Oxa1/YidC/SpoIIIJ protein YidD
MGSREADARGHGREGPRGDAKAAEPSSLDTAGAPRSSRRAATWLAIVAILVSLAAFDTARQPDAQWSARLAIGAIHLYQRHVAPINESLGFRCRFVPSCSHYAEIEIARYGMVVGGWRSVRRIARCGPWTPMGTVDLP